MCIAIPGEIIELAKARAKVSIMGVETLVDIQLIDNPEIGDFVLIHAGCAIEKIDKNYSDSYFDVIKSIWDSAEAGGE